MIAEQMESFVDIGTFGFDFLCYANELIVYQTHNRTSRVYYILSGRMQNLRTHEKYLSEFEQPLQIKHSDMQSLKLDANTENMPLRRVYFLNYIPLTIA